MLTAPMYHVPITRYTSIRPSIRPCVSNCGWIGIETNSKPMPHQMGKCENERMQRRRRWAGTIWERASSQWGQNPESTSPLPTLIIGLGWTGEHSTAQQSNLLHLLDLDINLTVKARLQFNNNNTRLRQGATKYSLNISFTSHANDGWQYYYY